VKRQHRLARSTELQQTRKQGRSFSCPLLVLVVMNTQEPISKIGIIAGRNVGGAVQRNRIKRQIRATLENLITMIKPGWNLLFIARQPLRSATYVEICSAVLTLIKRAGLYGCPA
jgi:ribonuclease P protein component